MNRKVTQISVHQVTLIPNAGNLKNTINQGSNPEFSMHATEVGVEVESKSKNVYFLVPWGNIIAATFAGPKDA